MSSHARVDNQPDLLKDQRSGAIVKTSAALAEAKKGKRLEKQVKKQQDDLDMLNNKVNQILALLTKDQ